MRRGASHAHKHDFSQALSLFTPDKTTSHDALAKQLRDLGLSDDEIRHYENEYHNGRTIVAVNAPGREEEALAICTLTEPTTRAENDRFNWSLHLDDIAGLASPYT